MKKNGYLFCILMGLLFLHPATVVMAEESAMGQVKRVTGLMEIQRAKQTVRLVARPDMEVFFGDTITTGDNSRGLIRLADDSIIRVHANSKIALNTMISPVEKKHSVLLFFGKLWNKISKKALRKKVFEVQTPTAVCGVRGTDFETASYEDGTMLVRVNSGEVEVDSEVARETLVSNQGTQVSFEQKEIRVEPDFKPDWDRDQARSRENLLGDGEKYGRYVHDEIYRRRDHLKTLVDRASDLKTTKEQLKQKAAESKENGDDAAYESCIMGIEKINDEQRELNREIAYYGRRLECHFGLFSRYGDLAKDPEISKRFKGREYIMNQLDDIEMVYAEFNVMIEEGMKMSMEDMEDLMDEMRDKMKTFKEQGNKSNLFEQLN
ncbi:MAG: FecR family protein [Desulfobacterales bacterium]|nr:FecR family protein [Desulfobacterales bacterium]MDX2511650.1 FecR family protein [Desulfobacterales bacterium]